MAWRKLPAPARGEYIRKFGEALRARKEEVAQQITTEAKKIISEGPISIIPTPKNAYSVRKH